MADANTILQSFKKAIDSYAPEKGQRHVGTVEEVFDGIVLASGLSDVKANEMVEFEGGVQGVALNLSEHSVGIIVLGRPDGIKAGQTVKTLGKTLEVAVSDDVIGRTLDALARPIDGAGSITSKKSMPIERIAPGVMARKEVKQPLQTGIKAIDTLVPIGRGQRELIIGDRQTGKTAVAIDTILNQKGQDVVCVYVSIGQKDSKLRTLYGKLKEGGAMDYTVIVSAGASAPASMNYLVPYTGTAIAEYFLEQGKDVLIVYDDLSKHADAYREISLLLRRPPGREAYPGDVFYLHSRLLERACKLNEENGGGSITALPIIETKGGDVSAYIPTNVISITDGQIYLESDLFHKGIRPAINVGGSVSRVGSSAQIKAMKKVAGTLKLDMAQYRELEAFAQFGSDLDEDTKRQLERGKRSVELLKQDQYSPMKVQDQVIVLYALSRGFLDSVPVESLAAYQAEVISYIESNLPEFISEITTGKNMWTEETEGKLKELLSSFTKDFTEANDEN